MRNPYRYCAEFSTKFWKLTRGFKNEEFMLHINAPYTTGYEFDLYVRIYTTANTEDFVQLDQETTTIKPFEYNGV